MEDDFESPEDLYNFEAIGNWRVVLQDDGKYEKVFVPGSDILRTIRTLLREIKEENEDYRDYSVKLLKFNVVVSKLLPIFVSMSENAPLETTILKIFICYTLPLTRDASCYENMRQGQLKFLDAFIQQNGFVPLVELVSESIAIDMNERNDQQNLIVELYLNFVRNLLCIRNEPRAKGERYAFTNVQEDLARAMWDHMVVETLCVLCSEANSFTLLLLDILYLLLGSYDVKRVFESGTQSTSNKSNTSSLRSMYVAEQAKRDLMLHSMPSSYTGSYSSTSINRLISADHSVKTYSYKPNIYIPRVAIKYKLHVKQYPISSFLQPIFLITVNLLNTCFDDYLNRVKSILDKGVNVLPSDYSHYFQLTAYMNRFVLCFITSSHHDCPLLQSQHDEDMKIPSLSMISHTISQSFCSYCLTLCRNTLCEETDWVDVSILVTNITILFDIYHFILSSESSQYSDMRYRIEMIVFSIMSEITTIQLLPSLLLLWKLKNGMEPLIATILGIDSLLKICEILQERNATILKRRRVRTKNLTTEEEQENGIEENPMDFQEIPFDYSFVYKSLYHPSVFRKYILLLFNYSFHSPEINQCLYHYFKSMFNYIEEESNATSDEDFNDQHQQDIQAILRPRLYCVLVLEVFNRIMHDPAASHSTGMNRKDIEDLASLGREIFTAFLSTVKDHPLMYAESLFEKSPYVCSMIARGYHSKQLTTVTQGNFISTSVLGSGSSMMEQEVDLDALPETIIPESLRPKKRHQREKKDVKLPSDASWNVESSDEGEDQEIGRVGIHEPMVRRVNREALLSGEGEEEVDLDSLQPSQQGQTATRRMKRLTILSDESEDESENQNQNETSIPVSSVMNPASWTEEEDETLRRLVEENKDMVDPWGIIVYDSFFLSHHRTPRMIVQHAIDLGLASPSTHLPEDMESKQVTYEASSDEDTVTMKRMKRKNSQMSSRLEETNHLIVMDSMSVEERDEVVSTNIQRLRDRDGREVIVKVMEELLENLTKALPKLREANDALDGKGAEESIAVEYPEDMKEKHKNAMILLVRSMRLVPKDTMIVIPSSLAVQDLTRVLGILKKNVDTLTSRIKQEKRRKERKAFEELPKEDSEHVEKTPSKKRRIILDDSD